MPAAGSQSGTYPRQIAHMPCRQNIRCLQKVAESGEVAFIITARSLADNDGFGAALGDDLLKLGGNRIKGLIPAHSLPVAICFLHGI